MPTEAEKRWIAGWRYAATELAHLKARELSQLTEEQGTMRATWLGLPGPTVAKPSSGLIQFQSLMKKWRITLGGIR